MARGKPKEPTALKILKGAHHKDPQRINRNEPIPMPGVPDVPDDLGNYGLEIWYWAVEHLEYMNILAKTDLRALELLARTYQLWRESHDYVTEHGMVIATKTGLSKSPYVLVAESAADRLRKCLQELGLTPASRASLVVDKGGHNTMPQARTRA